MDIFNIFSLLGGLAFFLFGMNLLSGNLQKMAGGKLEKMLQRITDNKFLGLIFGLVITVAIQSSSAMTVMLVGFVNSGIMKVSQTISVIMGSDIGTTLTAWILSLTGVDSSNVFIKLLNPKYFSPIVALIGILLYMLAKKDKQKSIGAMLLGFSILMTGMTMMSTAMSPLADMPEFQSILMAFSNPLLGVLIGTVLTAIVQSSAATIGILQALSLTGQVTCGMAIPIIMGENIGTCMTAILSAIGVNRKAKRVAVIHVSIKIIGTVIVMAVFYLINSFVHFEFLEAAVSPFLIAIFHTIFNLVIVAMCFPFQKQLEKLANFIIKDKEEEQDLFLDTRLFVTPRAALMECNQAMIKMTELTEKSLDMAMDQFEHFDEDDMSFMNKNELKIDAYEDQIGTYLTDLNNQGGLGVADKGVVSKILFGINEFERLADHALNLAKSSEELRDKNISFSPDAREEVDRLIEATRTLYNMAIECYRTDNAELARKCLPLKRVISLMCGDYKEDHIQRVQNRVCGPDQGFIFNDMLTTCERIGEHSVNVSICVIRGLQNDTNSRGYIHDIKAETSPEYVEQFNAYYKKFLTDPIEVR